MPPSRIDTWLITARPTTHSQTGLVALDSRVLASRTSHQLILEPYTALSQNHPRVNKIFIDLPSYRPASLVVLLAAIAAHLGHPGGSAHWHFQPKEQGMVQRQLALCGWPMHDAFIRKGKLTIPIPPTSLEPVPAEISVRLGVSTVPLFADYGVFSPGHLDNGTRLILQTALAGPPVVTVADIGTGYGALAIGMALNGHARHVFATDRDLIALYLARRNSERQGVSIDVSPEPDPAKIPPTDLTLCYLPTHVDRANTNLLLDGLAARARDGVVLIGLHASLARRYAGYLRARSVTTSAIASGQHMVLRFGLARGPTRRLGHLVVLPDQRQERSRHCLPAGLRISGNWSNALLGSWRPVQQRRTLRRHHPGSGFPKFCNRLWLDRILRPPTGTDHHAHCHPTSNQCRGGGSGLRLVDNLDLRRADRAPGAATLEFHRLP